MIRFRGVAAAVVLFGAAVAAAQTAETSIEAGFAALQRGDADAASRVFRAALARRPDDPIALYGAGFAEHLQGHDDGALGLLKRAVQAEPRLVQAAVLLGDIASRTGDLDLAIRTYERVLAQVPSNLAVRERLEAWRNEASVEGRFEAFKDDRFTIMFDGAAQQALAAHATATLGQAFFTIAAALGTAPSSPIKVVFYTRQQFHDVTGAPEWAGGGFDGQIRLPLGGASTSLADFDRVLVHELTHAMIHHIAPRNVPAWLHEGLAMRFEGHDADQAARRLAAARVHVPLRRLQGGFSRLTAVQAAVAYEESAVAADALLARIGPQGLTTLLGDLDRGEPLDQAVERFGFTFGTFEQEVAARVGARADVGPRR